MNPPYPQPVPQEFLIFHELSLPTPTKRTAWLIPAPQLLKIPDLYELQLEASTVTEIGFELIPLANPEHPLAWDWPEILKLPPWVLQAWSLPA